MSVRHGYRYNQSMLGMLILLPGQFGYAVPLLPPGATCRGMECPWHDRTAIIVYYTALLAVVAAALMVLWVRAASAKSRRKARRMRIG